MHARKTAYTVSRFARVRGTALINSLAETIKRATVARCICGVPSGANPLLTRRCSEPRAGYSGRRISKGIGK